MAAVLLLGHGVVVGAERRPITVDDLMKIHRVSDPQVSPDGHWVAFVVTDVVFDENTTNSDVWVIPAAGHATGSASSRSTGSGSSTPQAGSGQGGEARRLTSSPKHDRHPRWSPDGRWIAFESNRDGTFQIWLLPAPSAGSGQAPGEAVKLTSIATEAAQPVWAPTGDRLAFVSAVFPEFSDRPFAEADRLNREKLEAREKSKVKAREITQLLYRHWDSWVDDRRQHLFVVDVKDGAAAGGSTGLTAGEPRNVTPGENDAIPTSSTFSEGDDFDFSPDGKELAFAAPHHVVREQAWRTNHDLWTVNLVTGERRQLTVNAAADAFPRYSPDGKYLAYRAQARAGFEADRWQLRLMPRGGGGESWSLTSELDRSVEAFSWADGSTLVFSAQDRGTAPLWTVAAAGGPAKPVTTGGSNSQLVAARSGRHVYYVHSSLVQPPEIHRLDLATGQAEPLTRLNDALLAHLDLTPPESVVVAGQGGTPVQMWIMKPPGFDPAKKHPLVFWVHGGPQSASLDGWSFRWNAAVWAAQGYVVAEPNARGSTGFGQQFTDEISHDWGGKIFEDLMAAVAHLERQPWIDPTRMAAAGASFGGYMMNWFQGHTDKFRTLVTHCGVYDFVSMYGTTEEVWFDEWDHGIPWENPEFEKWSPHRHAAKFRTPNLIIHNELDFRVPIGQGLALFTTLQRKGIPSKLLYFPDEGHWVQKPQNSTLWHKTVFEWLAEYLQK